MAFKLVVLCKKKGSRAQDVASQWDAGNPF